MQPEDAELSGRCQATFFGPLQRRWLRRMGYASYTREQLERMLEIPDHLRGSYRAVLDLGGRASAGEVSRRTGRTRASESGRLVQLARMGYLARRKQGRTVVFDVVKRG